MMKILLNQFKCYSRHGVFREEQIIGGEFEVNLEVSFEDEGIIEQLDQTINYNHLQEIVKAIMSVPQPLLETICQKISERIKTDYPFVSEINITLSKLAPPIANFQGQVGVNYVKNYK